MNCGLCGSQITVNDAVATVGKTTCHKRCRDHFMKQSNPEHYICYGSKG